MNICDHSCEAKRDPAADVVVFAREDRLALRDELPPVFPDSDDETMASLIDPEVLERVKSRVEAGRARRYLAVSIDLPDLDALLAAAGGAP